MSTTNLGLLTILIFLAVSQIRNGSSEDNVEQLIDEVDPLLVTIPDGKMRGKVLLDKNENPFYAFQKIPHAKKPIGPLRFKRLEKVDKWNGILNATEIAPDCLQDSEDFSSEDCIYLNVFTHRKSELHPVMVYIYGGGLTTGSSNPKTTLGPEFLLTKDIVLVTFNYRLGILGFLNYEYPDNSGVLPDISSNNGFKDQVFALEWVQENIEYFGGDKHSVTLFGNSAGALSVHALLLSPLTKNLFHRAIAQSATAITRGLSMNNSAVYVGNLLGLDTTNVTNLMHGLRNLTEKEILKLQDDIDIYRLTINQITLPGLVIEKPGPTSFMSENPWTLIQTGRYHQRPVMFGFLNAEGIIYYVYRYLKQTHRYFNISVFIPYYYKQRDFLALEIDQDFFPTQVYEDIDPWVEIWGYTSFIFDILRCVRQQIKWSNVYFYEFSLDTDLNWSKWRAAKAGKLKGACHGDELGYLFKKETSPKIIKGSGNDVNIERMITMWTNFAIFGMPTIRNDSLIGNQHWLPVRKESFNIFRIGTNLTTSVYDMTTHYEYWQQFYEMFSSGKL